MIEDIRKTCKLCNSYRMFKAHDNSYRKHVEAGLEDLQRGYTSEFEELRRRVGTSDTQVANAKENKYFCMDLIPICRGCDREESRVANELRALIPPKPVAERRLI